jgi:hypothetical protein
MHPQFQLVNPFREPAWRFQRVLDLVERERPGRCTQQDDEYVRAYRRFAGKFRRVPPGEGQMTLFPRYPGMFLAHLFHHQPDKEWRWILQAHILTGETDQEIASRLAIVPSAVDWYEKIFFNVRDRLHARDYIVKQVIGKPEDRRASARDGALTEFQEQISYKLFGYFGGPHVLDLVYSGFLDVPSPDRVDRAGEWLDEAWRALIRRKSGSAARHLEVNKYNIMPLMELHLRIIEVAKDSGGSLTEYERNVSALLDGVPWELAERRHKQQVESVEDADYIDVAIEPRAEELMQMALGRVPQKMIKDRRLKIVPPAIDEET